MEVSGTFNKFFVLFFQQIMKRIIDYIIEWKEKIARNQQKKLI